MPTPHDLPAVTAILENLKFLLLEVTAQLHDTQSMLAEPTPAKEEKIFARDDYVDNLKSIIENRSFRLLGDERLPKPTVDVIRAVNVITSNLERIGDFATNIVGQLRYFGDESTAKAMFAQLPVEPYFEAIIGALGKIEAALAERALPRALQICRAEITIDQLFEATFRTIMDELRAGGRPESLVTALFIFRYLERIGDALLNIGEAIIFATIGEKLKVSEYQALEETLASSNVGIDASDLDYEGIWETRSGCKIATVHARGADKSARWVVFKEGRIRKVHEEKVALERWNELAPGIPPKVYGYHEHGYHASILLEYLEGTTFQKLLLQADPLAYQRAFPMMIATLRGVWEQTLEPGVPAKADFARQLRKRLPDIYKVHPDFAGASTRIGGVKQPGLDELVAAVEPLDAELTAPFQVLIHGDFNNDNLLVDEGRQIVHFIDLHRSRPSDWLQDVTVFLVSNFRMPVREANLRARIDAVNLEFRRFAAGFAADHGDRTWQARMALGLARSFVTSTRFELDPDFSKKLYLRAVYLLERLLDHVGQPWDAFTVPDDVLVD